MKVKAMQNALDIGHRVQRWLDEEEENTSTEVINVVTIQVLNWENSVPGRGD